MRQVIVGTVMSAALLTGGCVSENRPKPTMSGQSAPTAPMPTRMVVTSYLPRDTDSNGSPDLIPLRVHLFEAEGGWPLAVAVAGTYRFELLAPGDAGRAKPLASWDIDPTSSPRMLSQDQVGPCYLIELSLLAGGKSDRLTAETVDLHAAFTPTDAKQRPIRSVISMHFGRTR